MTRKPLLGVERDIGVRPSVQDAIPDESVLPVEHIHMATTDLEARHEDMMASER